MATTVALNLHGMGHLAHPVRDCLEVILRGARQVVGGFKLPSDERLRPLRSFMDDVTSILQMAPCMTRLLKLLDELLKWARMKVKVEKSRSLSLRKGEPGPPLLQGGAHSTAGGETTVKRGETLYHRLHE